MRIHLNVDENNSNNCYHRRDLNVYIYIRNIFLST